MKNKISIYLFSTKIKYILSTLFFISLFIQIINILEVAKIIENNNSNIISILYLSFLKLPTTMLEIIPFVVIISTAFFYRSLICLNKYLQRLLKIPLHKFYFFSKYRKKLTKNRVPDHLME